MMCFRHIISNNLYNVLKMYIKVTISSISTIFQYKISKNRKYICGLCSELHAIISPNISHVFLYLPSRYIFQVLVYIPPRSSCADARSSPPVSNVPVKFDGEVIVQHSAQSAVKLVGDEFSCTYPPKVRVIKVIVVVQTVQICSKFFWRFEIFHVDVRVIRRNEGIFFRPGPHHYRQDVVPGTVIRTVGITGRHQHQ